ncbi:hypothetical protein [Lysobacter capsici]|uniref:hypothetical protein n=1 Tax=Lysobacter capsici TaxID=435897 RepID=UPI001C00617A|nr:hypothetical protein [Lysobacter capsici]QWF16145.1 hypothetical protein KME82_20655 [Lysobacter capsici]
MNLNRIGLVCVVSLLAACGQNGAGPSLAPAAWGEPPQKDPPAWIVQAAADPALACFVDTIEGAKRSDANWQAEKSAPIRVSGWSVDSKSVDPIQRDVVAVLSGGGQRFVFKGVRSDRPDVRAAAQFAQLGPQQAGVTVEMNLNSLAPGKYELSYVVGDEAKAASCDLGAAHAIEVR